MRGALDLLRHEPRARVFFLAHAQSSLGTGASYVGLLILAYDRLRSPWAVALVLLADFLPAMFLGPVFGAAADRWSRRWCAVVADLMRAAAFVGLGLLGGIELTIAFALIAGAGSGLYTPAVLAGLPSLVDRERLPAATSLYGALADVGHTVGPAIAAAALLVAGPETLMIANGVTFALSAAALSMIPFGERPERDRRTVMRSLVGEARAGAKATAGMPGVRTVILASTAVILFAGMLNVGELLLASEELDASNSGFSVLVAIFGLGVAAGSLVGSRGGSPSELKRRYLFGLFVVAVGIGACGIAPSYPVALVAFAVGGLGNGLVLVHERLLLQSTVPDSLMGRVFGVKDAFASWGFAIAFLTAGAIIATVGVRELLLLAGAGGVLVWLLSVVALRDEWREEGSVEGLATTPRPRAVPNRPG